MNRRQFLTSASAFTLTAALPAASDSIITSIEWVYEPYLGGFSIYHVEQQIANVALVEEKKE